MGEIGVPRREFLYDLRFWEVHRIILGYRRRERGDWERVRWQTFWLMHNGMADLGKAGISEPADLIRFPWDTEAEHDSEMTDEEVASTREMLRRMNEKTKGTTA